MPTCCSVCSRSAFRQISLSDVGVFAFKDQVLGNIMLKFLNHKASWGWVSPDAGWRFVTLISFKWSKSAVRILFSTQIGNPNLWKMLRNTTAGLPRVTNSSRVVRTLLAVICGKHVTANGSAEQGVEINYMEPGNRLPERPVNGYDLSVSRNDGGLVLTDYEDLKKTGYLEVVTVLPFDSNIVMAYFLKFYSF